MPLHTVITPGWAYKNLFKMFSWNLSKSCQIWTINLRDLIKCQFFQLISKMAIQQQFSQKMGNQIQKALWSTDCSCLSKNLSKIDLKISINKTWRLKPAKPIFARLTRLTTKDVSNFLVAWFLQTCPIVTFCSPNPSWWNAFLYFGFHFQQARSFWGWSGEQSRRVDFFHFVPHLFCGQHPVCSDHNMDFSCLFEANIFTV